MENTFNTPNFIAVSYQFNPKTGYYEKTAKQLSPIACNAMPFELMREITQADQIKINAPEILTLRGGKKSNGSKRILTGLQPTIYQNWYIGNHYSPQSKKLSDILFYFYPDNDRMITFFFGGFHSNSDQIRLRFAGRLIPQLKGEFSL
jgi:hypothetical protein